MLQWRIHPPESPMKIVRFALPLVAALAVAAPALAQDAFPTRPIRNANIQRQ